MWKVTAHSVVLWNVDPHGQVFKSERWIHSDGCDTDDIRADRHISDNVASNFQTNVQQKHQWTLTYFHITGCSNCNIITEILLEALYVTDYK